MSYQNLRVAVEGAIARITLSRPDAANRIDQRSLREIADAAQEIAEDGSVVLTLVTADGADFCTGWDDATRDALARPDNGDFDPFGCLAMLPGPVLVALQGNVKGAGLELALACDFRIIAAGYRIGLPEARVGILPGAGGTQRMTRLLGTAKALELMLLGETVTSVEAERIGLVHRAVEPARLRDETLDLALELARRPRLSLALIKQCVLRGSEMPLVDGLRFEQDAFFQTMRSEDATRLMRGYLRSERPLDEQ